MFQVVKNGGVVSTVVVRVKGAQLATEVVALSFTIPYAIFVAIACAGEENFVAVRPSAHQSLATFIGGSLKCAVSYQLVYLFP